MGEREFLQFLRTRFAPKDPSIRTGAGPDDCALVRVDAATELALTTGTLLEGTHFTADDDPAAIGWKAVAASLSDLAASGCSPRWGLVAVGLRQGKGEEWAEQLARGMKSCADEYGLQIVGGDTTSGRGPVSITVTVIGSPLPRGPLLRGDAQAGDRLVVTGNLGGSSLGKHLHPTPRLREIAALLEIVPVHACIDITDGLALDLSRLMAESGTGAIVMAESIPIAPAAVELGRQSGRAPLDHALHDGEDFELLFTVSPANWERLAARWKEARQETPITVIGEVSGKPGLRLEKRNGEIIVLEPQGYEHDF